jgi:RNase adapter protein RapZ
MIMNENSAIVARAQLLIVTGYSGAGKSTVLRALEDIGFFCVDNLPIPLLPSFFQLITQSTMIGQKVALGIDIRSGKIMQELIDTLKQDSLRNYSVKIFFLTSSPNVLCKRYQETRRKHPLADTRNLEEAIQDEQTLLKPLMDLSDLVLDTDQLTIHQLRKFVRSSFSESNKPQLLVNLISFGFKYGIPLESNFIYDVRSLPNPYFVPELRSLDGTSEHIREYLFSKNEVQDYWNKLKDFIHYSIQKSYDEGRFFTNIAIGCTGGRHRSVAFVHELALHTIENVHYGVKHRDILQHTFEQ